MNSRLNEVIATGKWPTKEKQGNCPDNPKGKPHHFFEDVSSKPSGRKGEQLVTSQCQYCGILIVDCPTINAW